MISVTGNRRAHSAALVLRTLALLIFLYQIRLLATDVSDTSFFIVSLAGALATAFFLNQKKVFSYSVRPFQAVIIIALIPWAIRLFIAMPRWFTPGVSGTTIILDSLRLNLDRNYFSSLFPFYWVAFTTYFSIRSRQFLRADIIAADTFFLVLFSIVSPFSIEAYRWPVLMIGLFALAFFFQILAFVFSAPPEFKLQKKEGVFAVLAIFLLVFIGGALFVRPFQERAVDKGGGLLEPKLFRFDFSQIIRLESEISVNDDLVLIVKKDPYDSHILLRRYTLSAYNPKQGFFRLGDVDEAAHPQNLPGQRTLLRTEEIKKYRESEQEYYIVNFDSSAFIGMNMPVEVIPFETWDASSFNSAYAVMSHTSEAVPYELINSVRGSDWSESLGMKPEEYALYTEYGGDEAIANFAREIISDSINSSISRFPRRERENSPSYWEQVQMVYDRLKFGEYRYSLKPGIAADGNQLKHFLFNSKKGYCSYYAFAFTLMLRSLGIPCRLAAGFFVDSSTEAFGYYPVRADMAHAWAEVWFPGYGWIEYDPTTENIAEGEEFRFSSGTPPELFERLMKEILDNRSRLKAKEGEESESGRGNLASLGRSALLFISTKGPILVAALLVLLFLFIRFGFFWLYSIRRKPQKKALYLWAHVKRRMALAGFRKSNIEGEAEWAKAASGVMCNLYPIYLDAAAARFAPVFAFDDRKEMEAHYRLFSNEYKKAVTLWRRILACLLPPLALALGQAKRQPYSTKILSAVFIVVFIFLFRMDTMAQADPDSPPLGRTVDSIYESAFAAQMAENWERAIELFNEGAKTYPDDFRFPWSLGNLYYNRRLYNLAWDEYRKTEKIIPWQTDLLWQLANTAGYLNKNEASASYYERLLAIDPDNREAVSSLAWMYFKLHRLREGERLLLDAMEYMGTDTDFAMTLGTIYSGMFRYAESKDSYQKAIHGAEAVGDRIYAALSYYNLSILETRFYQFAMAFDCTTASLEAMDRASGKLARGELFLMRLELSRALADYQEAYKTDSSPLSKLNLAQAFQIGGRLSEAAAYANDCLKAGDDSWMMNYGIDPVRYKRDIHEILKDTYKGLLKAEAFSCPDSLKEKVQSLFRKITYRFRFTLHTHLFHKYCLLSADAFDLPGATYDQNDVSRLEQLDQYYNAFENYPRRALTYLRQARSLEEPLIPLSVPTYDFEEGRLFKNRRTFVQSLGGFDPLWERDMIANVYAELASIGKKAERQEAAERLFAINRGALLQNGIALPVQLRINSLGNRFFGIEGILKEAANSAGLETARTESPRYTLTFDSSEEEGFILCKLYDNGRGIVIWEKNLNLPASPSSSQKAEFKKALRDGIFDGF
jgi:tetratricopeptide (TPR) repeat protein